ncbi:MAG: hypothetical protein AABY22_23605 [Nanoarchaeota archaeon]
MKNSYGSKLLAEETYYENDLFEDRKQKPYEAVLLIRKFQVWETPKGNRILKKKLDSLDFTFKTNIELSSKLRHIIKGMKVMPKNDNFVPKRLQKLTEKIYKAGELK